MIQKLLQRLLVVAFVFENKNFLIIIHAPLEHQIMRKSHPQPVQSEFTPEKAHKVKVCISFALSTLKEKKERKNLNDKKEEK